MNQKLMAKNRFGQTALEYLLIIVVAVTLVVAIMYFTNASTSSNTATATQKNNEQSCRERSCSSTSDCVARGTPDHPNPCLFWTNPVCTELSNVGGQAVSGHCDPTGGYNQTRAGFVNGSNPGPISGLSGGCATSADCTTGYTCYRKNMTCQVCAGGCISDDGFCFFNNETNPGTGLECINGNWVQPAQSCTKNSDCSPPQACYNKTHHCANCDCNSTIDNFCYMAGEQDSSGRECTAGGLWVRHCSTNADCVAPMACYAKDKTCQLCNCNSTHLCYKIGEIDPTTNKSCSASGWGDIPICTPAILANLTCHDFDLTLADGTLACGPNGSSFDLSGCDTTGTFSWLVNKAGWTQDYSYPPSPVVTASNDAVCDVGSNTFNLGDKVKILSGPHAGTYTVSDFPKETDWDGVTYTIYYYTNCPIFGVTFVPPTPPMDEEISWQYMYSSNNANKTATTIPRCGDGIIQPEIGEVCDTGDESTGIPKNFNGKTCSSFGYNFGKLSCDNSCTYINKHNCTYYQGIANKGLIMVNCTSAPGYNCGLASPYVQAGETDWTTKYPNPIPQLKQLKFTSGALSGIGGTINQVYSDFSTFFPPAYNNDVVLLFSPIDCPSGWVFWLDWRSPYSGSVYHFYYCPDALGQSFIITD